MKTNEWAGLGNHTTAEFWEYDTRTGRRDNLDPITRPWESPYAAFNNSPIAENDVLGNEPGDGDVDLCGDGGGGADGGGDGCGNGGGDGNGGNNSNASNNETSNKDGGYTLPEVDISAKWPVSGSGNDPSSYNTPKFSAFYGDAYGPKGGGMGPTSITSLYGGKSYYNSGMWQGTKFTPSEPDNFGQFQFRFGDNTSHLQYSLALFKQKFSNDNGFGYEAPTNINLLGIAYDNGISLDNNLSLNFNASLGFGPIFGVPRWDNSNVLAVVGSKIDGYSDVGYGASAIVRVQASIIQRISIFASFIANGIHFTPVQTNMGFTQPAQNVGSIGAVGGVGINLVN